MREKACKYHFNAMVSQSVSQQTSHSNADWVVSEEFIEGNHCFGKLRGASKEAGLLNYAGLRWNIEEN